MEVENGPARDSERNTVTSKEQRMMARLHGMVSLYFTAVERFHAARETVHQLCGMNERTKQIAETGL